MKKIITLLALLLGVLLPMSASAAAGQAGWQYKSSHGMSSCELKVVPSPTASANGGIVSESSGFVVVLGEIGSEVRLRLICSREQRFDGQGNLTFVGPEGSYSGPTIPTVVGQDTPAGDVSIVQTTTGSTATPKGRVWSIVVPPAETSYTLSWQGWGGRSDRVTVKVVPIAPPVAQEQLAPVAAKAEQAYGAASEAYSLAEEAGEYHFTDRVASVSANFRFDLNSFGSNEYGKNPSARMGWGLDIDAFPFEGEFKLVLGLTFDQKFRQVPTAMAPNLPANGFNSWTDGKSFFVGPKVGGSWMPVKWFELRFWGSPGVLVNVWDTIPVSQLPDRQLYTGESQTKAAFGYKVEVAPNFVIGEHFLLGPSLGLEGNITPLPVRRGAYRGDSGELLQRTGHLFDVSLGFQAGAIF